MNRQSRPEPWTSLLRRRVEAARRIVVLGVGNTMKGDDAAGLIAADLLEEGLAQRKADPARIRVIRAYDVPENFTGQIRAYGPDLVVLVDAALGKRRAGAVFPVDVTTIAFEDLSTHKVPLSAFVRYLDEDIGAKTLILGIQPAAVAFGGPVSAAVRKAAGRVAAALLAFLD
jgi:hydrogenase 3 maturation protease